MRDYSISWEDAQTFLSVIERKSFSEAAKELGVGQPTVSRRIQLLEQRLNRQLFVRGKHGAQATAVAEELIPAAQQMAKWATEFLRKAEGFKDDVSGVVTIAAPPGVAVEQLAPFAAILNKVAPGISLEVLSAVEHVDLSRGIADMAIRTQYPSEPELVCLHEATTEPRVFASKDYAAKLKQPCQWQDLDWITWAGRNRDVLPRSLLEKTIVNFKPVFASDDYLVQKAAVQAGVGVLIMGKPLGLETTDLVEIETTIKLPPQSFYLVCAKSMQHLQKIKVVSDHLLDCLSR